ncbi:phosphohydrolase [Niastella yeongjuensis]|uniref:Phosphohydrolase n=1 Tax=Niastella yeongjuensis TaxID=354355 RepID=A0A1V9EJ15_9BACT|nr:Pycsar system effector family protein [Niastella yeongjuensis]OQP46127.1 phosphohydrolase [Niastella yeongjuensis]SEP17494.1 Predicted metal-dependent phosphohydrolase, HD superfamily [Niastella yeongjuensis]
MNYYTLLDEIKQYVTAFFQTHANDKLIYHNLGHTENVVNAAIEIANHYRLSDLDYFVVVTAAWFHDIGYYTDPTRHEEKGAEEAAAFLKRQGIDETTIQTVANCIRATKLPQNPTTLLEKIVADADLFHLGTSRFTDTNKAMRKEFIELHNIDISKEEWRIKTIRLLESHHYHTDYAQLLLNDAKAKHLEKLKEKLVEKNPELKNQVAPIQTPGIKPKLKPLISDDDGISKAKQKNRPERGIETMFRITSGNHQRLSDMADSKAHIMISVNSIIISVLLSVLLKNLEQFPQYTVPAMLLLAVSLVTIVFAILATRPNIPKGTFTQTDINEKQVNLLFFGNFFKMSMEDYTSGMLQMMDDRDFLYRSLIKDVYSQGVVLGTKYQRLRISYNVFMYGLIVSVIAFSIAAILTT